MPKYGMLIDFKLCTGCRGCELACRQEHNRPEGEYGIYVLNIKAEVMDEKPYFLPIPTDKCNLCGKRLARGEKPACAHNCWANVIQFGTIDSLMAEVKKNPGMVLWAPH